MHLDHDPAAPAGETIGFDEFLKVDIRVGTVVAAEVYEGAQHGFTVPDGPSYARDADDRHWRTMTALFAQTLR